MSLDLYRRILCNGLARKGSRMDPERPTETLPMYALEIVDGTWNCQTRLRKREIILPMFQVEPRQDPCETYIRDWEHSYTYVEIRHHCVQ